MTNRYSDSSLLTSLVISTITHIIILYICFFGISIGTKPLAEEKIITFELLPVSSVNNVKTKTIQKEKTIRSDDAKQVDKTKVKEEVVEEKKEVEKPVEPSKEETKPEAHKKDAEPLPEPKKEIVKKEELKETKPKEVKKEEAKKDPPKKEVPKKPAEKPAKKKKAPNDKEIDSLLKNLEKASDGNNKTNKQNREKSEADSDAFGNYDDTGPESLTNDELIRQQIMRKWNQPIASATEEIIVTVRLLLAIDGVVEKSTIISINCPPGKDILCSATKDSAIRAITNASPLVNLLPEDYSSWKEIEIRFDTRR